MRKITVNASKKYDVVIKQGALELVGEYANSVGLCGKACIISDSNVAPIYMDKVQSSLEEKGFEVCRYIFPAGEESKTADTFVDILNFLAQKHFTRKDTVFALGGGVTGDLAGFSAASYMRGIHFVQIPTSLLAAVDSSVGGKTGIDLKNGKNLAGAFYQPEIVVFDPEVLTTLPDEYFADGMAEIIKYAMIRSKGIDKLLLGNIEENLMEIIARCIEIKRDIVSEDEFEGGVRRILNFGHTAGHAIEAAANFSISHGRAVAVGMYIVTNAWEKRGLCQKGTCDKLVEMLCKFGLDKECGYTAEKL
ncbi:MAG: 3-dehydroquinate synthase, partial [Ruminococcaceae bacterium]|nr:3-dehydroquinate synthase [Oscillospiraceae bacterium]